MARFYQPGETLDLTAPTGGVVAGTFYKIGAYIVFATVTAAAGSLFAARVIGVFEAVPTNTGAAWAEGDVVYWDDTAKVFTKTTTSNTKAGVAVAAKQSATPTGRIRLHQSI